MCGVYKNLVAGSIWLGCRGLRASWLRARVAAAMVLAGRPAFFARATGAVAVVSILSPGRDIR